VHEEVLTRELGFSVARRRRAAFLRELQQVCVELGLGCEMDEQRGLFKTEVHLLVRGSRSGIDALLDYARVSGWSTVNNDGPGGTFG
jgi:hypothetical protein